MTDADGYWLAGLVDGEGCFALWTRRRRVGRSDNCQCVSFMFKIALRADDLAVLKKVRRLLGGIGKIGLNNRHGEKTDAYRYNGRPLRASPLAQYTVQRKEELIEVVRIFRRYGLQSKKRADFKIWARALMRFVRATQTAPRRWHALTNTPQIRPAQGVPLRRFWRIPTPLYADMQRYEAAIKHGRLYVQAKGAA